MKKILFIFLLSFMFDVAYSQWSTNYANNGTNAPIWDLLLNGNDLYVVGDFTVAGGLGATYAAIWDVGTLSWTDRASGNMGWWVDDVAISGGGNVYIGGFYFAGPTTSISQWGGGGIYTALGGGISGGNTEIDAFIVNGNSLFAGGNFTAPGSYIARWDIGTSTWSALGGGANNVVVALETRGSDVYAGGSFTAPGSYIAKWDISASTWSGLGAGTNNSVMAMAVSGANDLYVGGYFTQVDGGTPANYIAKWDESTGTWSALGGGTNGVVLAIAISGTDVYVGGSFTQVDGAISANNIAKYDASTGAWSALGSGTNNTVRTIVVNGSEIIAGGDFSTAGGNPNNYIATYMPAVMPIELLAFNAILQENSTVLLEWSTASEINNDYFTVERSMNGFDFEKLANISGAGTSSKELQYQLSDSKPFNGISYYRLTQTDFDGSIHYHSIVSVSRSIEDHRFLVFPNPIIESNILYLNKRTNVIVYNYLGIAVLKENGIDKLDISSLQKGVYLIQNQDNQIARFVIK